MAQGHVGARARGPSRGPTCCGRERDGVRQPRPGVGADWALWPKCQLLPFLAWCASGSRPPLAFLAEEGGSMKVALTIEPPRIMTPAPW